jgi:hypothetical protein
VPEETATASPEATPKSKPKLPFQGVSATLHAYVGNDGPDASGRSPAPLALHSLRVQSTPAADRGIFETVIGSLLTFFLG